MRKSLLWIVPVTVALITLLAYIASHRLAPGPNLFTLAKKVSNVQDAQSYDWLSDHELIVQTAVNQKQAYPYRFYLDMFDTRTDTHVRLDDLTAVISAHRKHAWPGPGSFERSPNREWLVWSRQDPIDGGTYQASARLDGTNYYEWKTLADDGSRFMWGGFDHWVGSSTWISDVRRRRVRYYLLRDAAHPSVEHLVPVNSKEAKNLNALPKLPDPMWPTSGSILDAAPTPNGVGFDIRQTSAGATAPEAATLIDHITFPTTSKIWDNMANPQGTRRAFMMSDSQVPGYAALIHRLIPSYTYPAHPIERICIYRADSRELYEVGRVKETSNSNPDLINVGWLPDGKQIQFMYKNAVYVVDVD